MKRLLVIVPLFVFAIVSAQDENEKRGFEKERIFIGGNFGLVFGDYTLLNLSPQIGYRFNSWLAAGTGINALYLSQRYRNPWGNTTHKEVQGLLGLNIFGRVYPVQYLMLQVQPEINYLFGKVKYYDMPATYPLPEEIVPSILAGGGVVIPSERSAFILSIMYDLIQDRNSPYGNRPFISFGYNFHL